MVFGVYCIEVTGGDLILFSWTIFITHIILRDDDDDEYLVSEISGYPPEFTSSLYFGVDTHINDINNPNNTPFAYSNPLPHQPPPPLQQPQQGFQFNAPVPIYTSDGGSPSHVPLSPTFSPLPPVLSPFGVPSPTSTSSSSPSSPETVDIKPPPFLHLHNNKKRPTPSADTEQWGEYVNPAKAYSDLYDSHNRLMYGTTFSHVQFSKILTILHIRNSLINDHAYINADQKDCPSALELRLISH